MILQDSSSNSPSDSRRTNSSTAFRDQKLDRFATPASISYNRYGDPIVGVPERPSKRIVRHEIEAKPQPEKRTGGKRVVFGPPEPLPSPPPRKVQQVKRSLNPTYSSSPDNPLAGKTIASPYQKKLRKGSQRCAARQQFETNDSARRELQNRSSNFMNNQAACLEMERISWRTQHCGRRL